MISKAGLHIRAIYD